METLVYEVEARNFNSGIIYCSVSSKNMQVFGKNVVLWIVQHLAKV